MPTVVQGSGRVSDDEGPATRGTYPIIHDASLVSPVSTGDMACHHRLAQKRLTRLELESFVSFGCSALGQAIQAGVQRGSLRLATAQGGESLRNYQLALVRHR